MYSKHKDTKPSDTIARIEGIFHELQMKPSFRLLKNTNGVFSAFLFDSRHGWHVNGKGTSEEYCKASAYGEAMERLQAYFVYDRLRDDPPAPGDGFIMYPDEKYFQTGDCKSSFPFVYEELRAAYALEQKRETEDVSDGELDAFLRAYFMEKAVLAPYYGLHEDEVVYLPEQMVSALCGSNGLCAGNTPCEALNQGIAEILERHVKEEIFRSGATPPDVPRSFLQERMPQLYETIEQIEGMGPYRIIIKDASMGTGMPVIGALFVDRQSQRYHVKFGASFSMHVAVERCLTELFQGFDLKNAASHEHLMTAWNVESSRNWALPSNRQIQLKSDTGSIPVSFIAGNESWPFRDWEITPGYGKSSFDNQSALSFMIEKLRHFEPHIYIRDYGFLGFPAYRVYVPGVSSTHLPLGPDRMRFRIEKTSVDLLKRYPAVRLNQKALDECRHFITAEENLVREPFDDVPTAAVQAIFFYLYGDTERAIRALRSLPEKQFVKKYRCAAMELELQQLGIDAAQRDKTLELFFEEAHVRYAKRAFRKEEGRSDHAYLIDRVLDPQGKKLFSPAPAPRDADRARLHDAMRDKMRSGMPDQAKLKELFEKNT